MQKLANRVKLQSCLISRLALDTPAEIDHSLHPVTGVHVRQLRVDISDQFRATTVTWRWALSVCPRCPTASSQISQHVIEAQVLCVIFTRIFAAENATCGSHLCDIPLVISAAFIGQCVQQLRSLAIVHNLVRKDC